MKHPISAFSAILAGLFSLISGLISGPIHAQSVTYTSDNPAEISILPGWRQSSGSHMAALRIQLASGWKTYWRAPGEGGIAPAFEWSGSQNIKAVVFHWPIPEIFDTAGMQTLGYYDELILPIEIFPKREGQDVTLKGSVFLGVCSDVCMPMEARFEAVLNAGAQGADVPLIRAALKDRPSSANAAGLTRISCDFEPISDGLRVTARMALPRVGGAEFVVIEPADQAIWVSEAQVSRQGRDLMAIAELVPPAGAPFMLSRSDIRITVLAGGQAVDITSCVLGS